MWDLFKALASRVETVRVVRTAINPLLWLDVVVGIFAFGATVWAGDPWLRGGFFVLFALSIIATFAAYFMLLWRDPDRLQSEEYRLRQRALNVVLRRGVPPEVVDATREIVRIDKLDAGFGDGDER